MNARHFFSDWYYLAIRNIKQIWRPWLALVPSLLMPLFFFWVGSQAFSAVALLPNFPAESYLLFIAPLAIFMSIFFGAGNAGIELVVDISSGYFNKLVIMPINKLTIILGKLTEVAVQATMQGLIVFIFIFIFTDVRPETGFLGIIAMFAMLVLFAMAWSNLSMILALRTKNPRLVQSLFIIGFPFLYITTGQMPREFMPETFATLVSYNPVTYIIEGVRALMLSGWGDQAILRGFAVEIALFIVLVSITLYSFRKILK